ncbi:MAG: tectonin domain-containing protein [Candidatus Brocadiia bacterium]
MRERRDECVERRSGRGALELEQLEPRLLLSAITERVSLAWDDAEADGGSWEPALSEDGRYVAFHSSATNLVSGDTNAEPDIFVYDRQLDTIERVSVASDGTEANGGSYAPAITPDGRYVAFYSGATNLVASDTNGQTDVFVYDRDTDTVERVSLATDGTQGDQGSWQPAISSDGRYVAFESNATNLVTDDTNAERDIFVYDRDTDSIERVSLSSGGDEGDDQSWKADLSADGRYVAFESRATNLVAGDTNAKPDVFVYDRNLDTIERVSVSSGGTEGDGNSTAPAISADGRYVTFDSTSTNLVSGDTNAAADVFVYDRDTDTTERVSLATDGTEGDGGSWEPAISAGGRFVAFYSYAANLVSDDTNGEWDVFVYDRLAGGVERVSEASGGVQSNGGSFTLDISPDGRYVGFESLATNLVADDTNGVRDIFVHDRDASPLVWGLNAADGIFAREGIALEVAAGTGWDRVAGKLEQVSVGEGAAWGINAAGGIFVREGVAMSNPAGTAWMRAPGKLVQVSVGEASLMWGLNSNDGIFVRTGISESEPTGTGWDRVPGKLASVSVGEGVAWGLNSNGGIFVRDGVSTSAPTGTGWLRVPGKLAQISVGQMGLVWGLNANGGIFVREGVSGSNILGTGWTRVSGSLAHVCCGWGEVWAVDPSDAIVRRMGVDVTSIPEGTDWESVMGRLRQVSVGLTGIQTEGPEGPASQSEDTTSAWLLESSGSTQDSSGGLLLEDEDSEGVWQLSA